MPKEKDDKVLRGIRFIDSFYLPEMMITGQKSGFLCKIVELRKSYEMT